MKKSTIAILQSSKIKDLIKKKKIKTFLKNKRNIIVVVGLVCVSLVIIIIGITVGFKSKPQDVSVICNNTSKSIIKDANPRYMIHTEIVGRNRHGLYLSNYDPTKRINAKSFKFKSLKSIYVKGLVKNPSTSKRLLDRLDSANITAIADYVTVSTDKKTNNEIFVGTRSSGLFSVSLQTSGIDNYSITNIAQIVANKALTNVQVSASSHIVSLNILRLDTPTKDGNDVHVNTNLLIQTYKSDSEHLGGIYKYRITDSVFTPDSNFFDQSISAIPLASNLTSSSCHVVSNQTDNQSSFFNTNYITMPRLTKQSSEKKLKLTDVPLAVAYKVNMANNEIRDYSSIIFAANNYREQEKGDVYHNNVLLNLHDYNYDDTYNTSEIFFGSALEVTYSNKNNKNNNPILAKKVSAISRNIDSKPDGIDSATNNFANYLGLTVAYNKSGLYSSYSKGNNMSLQNIDNISPPQNDMKYAFQNNTTIRSLNSKHTYTKDNINGYLITWIDITVCFGNNFSYVTIDPGNSPVVSDSGPTVKVRTLQIKSPNIFQNLNWVGWNGNPVNNTVLGLLGGDSLNLILTKTEDKNNFSIVSKKIDLG